MGRITPGMQLFLPFITLLMMMVCSITALKCYQCGQYTDGVGSITPCLNFTEGHLKECPKSTHTQCIKYVTEGSIVRDCTDKCAEKRDSWGTKVFCCSDNACNAAAIFDRLSTVMTTAVVVVSIGRVVASNWLPQQVGHH